MVTLPVRAALLPITAPSLYPNPTTGSARLTGSTAGASVRVLDAVGRLVLSTSADATGSVYLSLKPGVYLVQNGSNVLRLAVQ